MSSATPKHILTAPAWPYANGPRHIGHVSGFGLPSDMFSRYQRMAGGKVLMISGTDEHGTPIQVQADKENTTPARAGHAIGMNDRQPHPRRPGDGNQAIPAADFSAMSAARRCAVR